MASISRGAHCVSENECWRNCWRPWASRSVLRYSDHIEGNGAQFFKEACKLGLEGIVSKQAESAYESTRSRNWLKIKCIKRQEFVIAGYTLSDKGIPFSSLILGFYEKGKLIYAGRAGTGYTNAMRVELKKKLDRIAVDKRPFAEIPKDPDLRKRRLGRTKASRRGRIHRVDGRRRHSPSVFPGLARGQKAHGSRPRRSCPNPR